VKGAAWARALSATRIIIAERKHVAILTTIPSALRGESFTHIEQSPSRNAALK
jgi:hypothetical protein